MEGNSYCVALLSICRYADILSRYIAFSIIRTGNYLCICCNAVKIERCEIVIVAISYGISTNLAVGIC